MMTIQHGCVVTRISDNHKAVKCSICNYKIHIKCNKIDVTYEKNEGDYVFCLKCQEEIIQFQQLSDQQVYLTSEKGINKDVDLLNLSVTTSKILTMHIFGYDDDAPSIH